MSHEITRRQFLLGTGAAVAALPFMSVGKALSDEKRPNFVFILTDDHRYDAMSCAGHPFLHTPNMDRIAKEGARFTNAFVTTALCSPSRASFLTGRYAHSHGVINNSTPLSDDIPTFAQVLQSAGWDTAYIGKWHMGAQEGPRPGFNRWVSFKGQGVYYNPLLNIDGVNQKTIGYNTDLLTKYALEWLRKPRTAPFCLYLSYKAVHGPFMPAVRHSKLFSDVKIGRPANMTYDMSDKPAWVRAGMEAGHDSKGALGDPAKFDEFIRDYNRTLVAVDEGVGQVLRQLEASGVLDDTVVVFAGDNGYFQGEHGRLDKRAMYEESIRIPMIMRYPRLVRPRTIVDKMVLNIDLCPTFLDIAGLPCPEGVQGRSFVPILTRRRGEWREDFLYEYFQEKGYPRTPTMRGVRTERWKYVEYPDIDDIGELYDLTNDPLEMHNLVSDARYERVLAEMRSRLKRLMAETGYIAGAK